MFLIIVVVAFVAYWVFRRPLEAPTVPVSEKQSEAPLATSVQSDKESVESVASSVTSEEKGETTKIEGTALVNENIRVKAPALDAAVSSPFIVAGEARVFENVVHVRVTNAKGEAFINETAYAKAKEPGEFGAFAINLTYKFKNTKEGFVEVYSTSAKDGSEENLIRVPVTFQ